MQLRTRTLIRFIAVFAIATLGLVALAACSDSNDDGGSDDNAPAATEEAPADSGDAEDTGEGDDQAGSNVDACSLITKDEAEAALGESVGDVDSSIACQYDTESAESSAYVGFVLNDLGGDAAAQTAYDSGYDVALSFDATTEELSGLGDEAYWDPQGGTVNVLKGRYLLVVYVADPGGVVMSDQAKQAAIDLAGTAEARVP